MSRGEMHAMLSRLAQVNPWQRLYGNNADRVRCFYCGSTVNTKFGGEPEEHEHREGCLWAEARAWQERQ